MASTTAPSPEGFPSLRLTIPLVTTVQGLAVLRATPLHKLRLSTGVVRQGDKCVAPGSSTKFLKTAWQVIRLSGSDAEETLSAVGFPSRFRNGVAEIVEIPVYCPRPEGHTSEAAPKFSVHARPGTCVGGGFTKNDAQLCHTVFTACVIGRHLPVAAFGSVLSVEGLSPSDACTVPCTLTLDSPLIFAAKAVFGKHALARPVIAPEATLLHRAAAGFPVTRDSPAWYRIEETWTRKLHAIETGVLGHLPCPTSAQVPLAEETLHVVRVTFLLRIVPANEDDSTAHLDARAAWEVCDGRPILLGGGTGEEAADADAQAQAGVDNAAAAILKLIEASRSQGHLQVEPPGPVVASAQWASALIDAAREAKGDDFAGLLARPLPRADALRVGSVLGSSADFVPSEETLGVQKQAREVALDRLYEAANLPSSSSSSSSSSSPTLPPTLRAGTLVVRGPGWKMSYEGQDGVAGGEGSVVGPTPGHPGWLTVRWATGRTYAYNCDAEAGEGTYEVVPKQVVGAGEPSGSSSSAAVAATTPGKKRKRKAAAAAAAPAPPPPPPPPPAPPLPADKETLTRQALAAAAQATDRYTSVTHVIDTLEPPATAQVALHPAVQSLRLTAAGPGGELLTMRPYQRQALHWMVERELVYEINQGRKTKSGKIKEEHKAARQSLSLGSLGDEDGEGGGLTLSQGTDGGEDTRLDQQEGVDVPVLSLDHPLHQQWLTVRGSGASAGGGGGSARSGSRKAAGGKRASSQGASSQGAADSTSGSGEGGHYGLSSSPLDSSWLDRMRAAARKRYLPTILALGHNVKLMAALSPSPTAAEAGGGGGASSSSSSSAAPPSAELLHPGADLRYILSAFSERANAVPVFDTMDVDEPRVDIDMGVHAPLPPLYAAPLGWTPPPFTPPPPPPTPVALDGVSGGGGGGGGTSATLPVTVMEEEGGGVDAVAASSTARAEEPSAGRGRGRGRGRGKGHGGRPVTSSSSTTAAAPVSDTGMDVEAPPPAPVVFNLDEFDTLAAGRPKRARKEVEQFEPPPLPAKRVGKKAPKRGGGAGPAVPGVGEGEGGEEDEDMLDDAGKPPSRKVVKKDKDVGEAEAAEEEEDESYEPGKGKQKAKRARLARASKPSKKDEEEEEGEEEEGLGGPVLTPAEAAILAMHMGRLGLQMDGSRAAAVVEAPPPPPPTATRGGRGRGRGRGRGASGGEIGESRADAHARVVATGAASDAGSSALTVPGAPTPTAAPVPSSLLPSRPQHPEYSVALPWMHDAPIIRAHDHPLWQRIPLECDAEVAVGKKGGSAPTGTRAFHPCCNYFLRPELGTIIRERCAECAVADLYARPKALPGLPIVQQQRTEDAGVAAAGRGHAAPTQEEDDTTVGFDGVARGGMLCDQMGLGKTLEVIALLAVHAHSAQPFLVGSHATGTRALAAHIASTPVPVLRESLRELARLPTHASIAFEVANNRAAGRFNEKQARVYSDFVAKDPYKQLTSNTDASILESRATLVIVPSSIAGQWEAEVRKWCPSLAVVMYSGAEDIRGSYFCPHKDAWRVRRDRSAAGKKKAPGEEEAEDCAVCAADMYAGLTRPADDKPPPPMGRGDKFRICGHGRRMADDAAEYPCCAEAAIDLHRMRLLTAMAAADMVVATYDHLAVEMQVRGKSGRGMLMQIFWHRVVLDEVQMVEGKADAATSSTQRKFIGKRTEAAMDLQASHRWAVSGTPLEAPEDVQAVLRFLRQQPFADPDLWSSMMQPAFAVLPDAAAEGQRKQNAKRLIHVSVQPSHAALGNRLRDAYKTAVPGAAPGEPPVYTYGSYTLTSAVRELLTSAAQHWDLRSFPLLGPIIVKTESISFGYGMHYATSETVLRGMDVGSKTGYTPALLRTVLENATILHGAVGSLLEEDRLALAETKVEALLAEAAISPLVHRLGSGLDLLASILRPIMWRNTQARVRAAGQLTLPPVEQVCLRVRLSAGEEKVLDTLARSYRDGIQAQLKGALAGAGGTVDAQLALADAHAAAQGARIEVIAQLQTAVFAAANSDLESLKRVAKQALWDLRSACAHLSASARLTTRLGLRALSANTGSSLHEVMHAFVSAAEDSVHSACVEYAESAIKAGEAAVTAVRKLWEVLPLLKKQGLDADADAKDHEIDIFDADVDVKEVLKDFNGLDTITIDDVRLARALNSRSVCKECTKRTAKAHDPPCNELSSLREATLIPHVRGLLASVPAVYRVVSDALGFTLQPLDGYVIPGGPPEGSSGGSNAAHGLGGGAAHQQTFSSTTWAAVHMKGEVPELNPTASGEAAQGGETKARGRGAGKKGGSKGAKGSGSASAGGSSSAPPATVASATGASGDAPPPDEEAAPVDAADTTAAAHAAAAAAAAKAHDPHNRRAAFAKAWMKLLWGVRSKEAALTRLQVFAEIKAGKGKGKSGSEDADILMLDDDELLGMEGAGGRAAGGPPVAAKRATRLAAQYTLGGANPQNYAEAGFGDRSTLTLLRALGKTMLERDTRMRATKALLPPKLSKLRFSLAAETMTRALTDKWRKQGAAGSAAATTAAAEMDDDTELACCICMSQPENETDAALTPCCHLYCLSCITSWMLEKNGHYSAGMLGKEEAATLLKPTMIAPCPTCKTSFRASDLYTVDVRGVAEEVQICTLEAFLLHAEAKGPGSTGVINQPLAPSGGGVGSGGGGGGSGGAAPPPSSSSSSSSSAPQPLPAPADLSSSAVVNAIPLTGNIETDVNVTSGKAESSSAGMRKETKKASRADLYGGKIACLVRRLRALPPGEKAVVATSWPHLTSIVATALHAEGLPAVVLKGSPTDMAEAVKAFIKPTTTGGGGAASASSSAMDEEEGGGEVQLIPSSSSSSSTNPIRALVLSMATDCAGLTLTAANHLFVFDPVLSPAVMAQLIGRICRQGQTRKCYVYHMAVAASAEERMIRLRHRLALGEGGAGQVGTDAVDQSARVLLRKGGKVDDANSASTDRLSAGDMLYLLDGPQA